MVNTKWVYFKKLYCIYSTLLDAGLEVEVKDPPKGMIPPGTQMVKPKAEPQPSKVSLVLFSFKFLP